MNAIRYILMKFVKLALLVLTKLGLGRHWALENIQRRKVHLNLNNTF